MPTTEAKQKATDKINIDHIKDVNEGSLIVVYVGDNESKPTNNELKLINDQMANIFSDLVGVKVLILPYTIKLEKISLNQIRTIYNDVQMAPKEKADQYNPVVDMDLDL